MPRPAWIACAALAVVHIVVSHATTGPAHAEVTYVFTPLVDVVPGGVPLTAGEAASLSAEAKNRVDARDIQEAYARMGSTISLDDLLRGVEGLEGGAHALSSGQRERIGAVLEAAKADHAAVLAVQEEILELEGALGRDVEAVLAALPEADRARLLARVGSGDGPARKGAPMGPGGRPGPGSGGPPSGGMGAPPSGAPPSGAPPAGGMGAPPAGAPPSGTTPTGGAPPDAPPPPPEAPSAGGAAP